MEIVNKAEKGTDASRFVRKVNDAYFDLSDEEWVFRYNKMKKTLREDVKELNDALKHLALGFEDPLPWWVNNAFSSRIHDIALENADWEDIDFGSLSRFESLAKSFLNACWDVQDEDAHPRSVLGFENA